MSVSRVCVGPVRIHGFSPDCGDVVIIRFKHRASVGLRSLQIWLESSREQSFDLLHMCGVVNADQLKDASSHTIGILEDSSRCCRVRHSV